VGKNGQIEAERVAVEERDTRLDDAVALELLDATPAGGGLDAHLCRYFRHG